jgi:hypothetical protein
MAKNPGQSAGMILAPHINAESVEIEAEFRDAFDHRSGHRTLLTGTHTVMIVGVPSEKALRIKKLLEEA